MTDALKQAAQQALEAMEDHANQYPHMQKGYTVDAIEALRAALSTPQAEPNVVWMVGNRTCSMMFANEADADATLCSAGAASGLQKVRVDVIGAAPHPAAPAPEFDVRTILLDIVPGDGDGHEVYAKTVVDVERKLTEMGQRIEELEGAAPQPAAPAPEYGGIQALGNWQAAEEPSQPEFFARLDYDKDFNVLVSVYRRRADATPVLVHQEPMKAQEAAPAPERVPLTDEQIDAVTDEAHRSLRRACSGAQGQQITIWHGIEAHVVRCTERAHGIGIKQPGSEAC